MLKRAIVILLASTTLFAEALELKGNLTQGGLVVGKLENATEIKLNETN